MMMIFVVFIVGVFYCLDALHGERRDRSILSGNRCRFRISPRALQNNHSAGDSAGDCLCARGLRAGDHAADKQRKLLGTSESATTFAHFPVFQNWLVMLYGLIAMRSGMHRSTVGYCWSPVGRGAQRFSGRCCH